MLLRYFSSLARRRPSRQRSVTPRPRKGRPLHGPEELEPRYTPAHILLWVGSEGNPVNSTSWVSITDGQYYAPVAGDSLIFDPSMTVGNIQGRNTSPATLTTNLGYFQNVTLARAYTGMFSFDRFTLTIGGNLNMTGSNKLVAGRWGSIAMAPGEGSTGTFTFGAPGVIPDLESDVTIASNATMNFQGPGIVNGEITNNGTVNFLYGGFTVAGPAFDNYGTVDLQYDDSFGADYTFYNEPNGTFKKSGGSGTSTVASAGFYNMGYFFLNSGVVSLTGGSLYQYKKPGSSFNPQTELNGGGLQVSAPYIILGGFLDGVGTINGPVDNGDPTGTYPGAGYVHPGLLSADGLPGFPGQLSIVGNFTQTGSGTLWIDVQGWGFGSGIGFLNVQGTATLDGTLHVYRYDTDNVKPTDGYRNFLQWQNVSGGFNNIVIDNNSWTVGGVNYWFLAAEGYNFQNAYSLVVQ